MAIGAVVAMVLQRYVIIIGTAFGGAWTMLLGLGAAVAGGIADRYREDAVLKETRGFYPLSPVPNAPWVPFAWVALGVSARLWRSGSREKR